jgi:Ribbon-Helix-Helix transcriptional regulator family
VCKALDVPRHASAPNYLADEPHEVRHSRHAPLTLARRSRADLEAALTRGELLHINVLGLASIAHDVTAELARASIASITVLGALQASSEVKAALADRTH